MIERIQKSFRRVISTAAYETITVENLVEREIEYSSDAERKAKVEKLSTDAVDDLVNDVEYVCEKMGVEAKRIFVKSDRTRPAGI